MRHRASLLAACLELWRVSSGVKELRVACHVKGYAKNEVNPGASNYEVWALRTDSVLIKEGLKEAIINGPPLVTQEIDEKALADIRLLIEDGPLLQIRHVKSAKEAWNLCKTL
jgi:hypothetical protein